MAMGFLVGGVPRSLTEGEDVDGSSRRAHMDPTVVASDIPSVTLRAEG